MVGEVSQLGKKKEVGCESYKRFLLEKMGPTHHIMRPKRVKSPYLDNKLQQVASLLILICSGGNPGFFSFGF